MKDWKELLRGGFADVEAPLAIKPPHQRRAREMVYVCKVLKVSLKEILQEAKVYLASKSQNKALIQDQLDSVKRYYKPVKFDKNKRREPGLFAGIMSILLAKDSIQIVISYLFLTPEGHTIGRSPGTISRESGRNSGLRGYRPRATLNYCSPNELFMEQRAE